LNLLFHAEKRGINTLRLTEVRQPYTKRKRDAPFWGIDSCASLCTEFAEFENDATSSMKSINTVLFFD
jgi:hypothetical protein